MKLFIFLVLVLLIVLFITYIGDVLKRRQEPIVLNFKKWVFPNSVYPNWYKVVQNGYSIKMSDTGITLPNNKFSISFMYNLSATNGGHNTIFRISNTNSDWGNYGDRIRAVWVNPNDPSFLLVLQTDNNVNESVSFTGVDLNTSALITFLFNSNIFTMYINNQMKYTKIFNDVIVYPVPSNSILYIGDKFYPGKGEIIVQDFTIYDGILTGEQINTIYTESISRPDVLKQWVFPNSVYPNWYKVMQNGYSIKMIDTGLTLPTNTFSMSFMYKLTALNNAFNNIVHITNSGGDSHRCPGIWINPNEKTFHLSYVPYVVGTEKIENGIELNVEAFITFIFDNNRINLYVNGINKFSNDNTPILDKVLPTATMYIGSPHHNIGNGTIQIQDFTLYDGVLRPDQIKTIYSQSTKEGRAKKIQDQALAQSKTAEEQRALQKSADIVSTLTKLDNQLATDVGNNDIMGIENTKNRIQQYQNI